MNNESNPIVFFGTEDFSLVSLKALVEAGATIAAVVTKPDMPKGRGHRVIQPAVKVYAEQNNIPTWQPSNLNEIIEKINNINNPIGVLVSYGKIIPQSILDKFTPGIINLHPSLLPKYRGPSPIESAIVNGDKETGVSIMKLTAAMDAGPIYQQVSISLDGSETAEVLYEKLGRIGADLLVQILPSIIAGNLQPVAQDDSKATYCKIIQKSDGLIEWDQAAKSIESRIRAFHLWPRSRTNLGKIEVIITKAEATMEKFGDVGHIEVHHNNTITIDCATGSLKIISLNPLGKKEMPVHAFLAGYRSQIDS